MGACPQSLLGKGSILHKLLPLPNLHHYVHLPTEAYYLFNVNDDYHSSSSLLFAFGSWAVYFPLAPHTPRSFGAY